MNPNELIHRYLLGVASEDEVHELESRLQRDEELQDEFLLQAELDAHLRQEAQSGTMTGDRVPSQFEPAPGTTPTVSRRRIPNRVRAWQWGSIGLAAAVALALFLLVYVGGQPPAMAAVQRALNVAAELTTRKYSLQVEFQTPNGETRTIDNDLYVHGTEHFALRHPGLRPGTGFWLGRDGAESWVVPASGPVHKGDKSIHRHWLESLRGTPQEHGAEPRVDIPLEQVTELLPRMSREYHLNTLADGKITIAAGGIMACRHINAQRKTVGPSARPDTIDLWVSRESGMAVRIIARWDRRGGEVGRKSVLLTYQNEEPSLPNDWFKAEGHCEDDRTRLNR